MRDYVIINGVSSLTIEGLAIKTLPSIIKAPIRTIREEIDGRDGDLTTPLGYGAYDKTLEIGLFGNYNVDDVIAFFNTSGTIVFSDESTKVYNFEIVDVIDFAKLIKFRTATINIHCQPFKYPLSETPIVQSFQYVNGNGTSISLSDTAEVPFAKLDLKGNTLQTGTPTPTTPIAVNVVSGSNIIEIRQENLFDKETITMGKRFDNGTPPIEYNDDDYFLTDYILVKPSTSYTGNSVFTNIYNRIAFYDANKTWLSNDNGGGASTITTPSNCYYMRFGKEKTQLDTFMLVEGAIVPSEYQPYKEQSFEIDLGDLELCKIDNAQDYIHRIDGGWAIHREVKKVVLDGNENENWSYGTSGGFPRATLMSLNDISTYNDSARHIGKFVCSHFEPNTTDGTGHMYQYQRTILCNPTNDITSLADWKTWLGSNNVDLYYILETPTEEAIEDANLINQLNMMLLAKSYDTTTSINQANDDLSFILDVSTMKKGTNVATITNGGNVYSKPTIEISGNGFVSVYLNNVQMFNVDLTEENEIVIDTDQMEATNPNTLALANRQVVGDYSKFKLEAGSNNISFGGNLTQAKITNYTRWL